MRKKDRIETDHIPDELVDRYGADARRAVRYTTSLRYRLGTSLAHARDALWDPEVWALAAAVFMWSLVVLGFLGGIALALVLWPWAALYVVLPILVLLGISLAIAARIN